MSIRQFLAAIFAPGLCIQCLRGGCDLRAGPKRDHVQTDWISVEFDKTKNIIVRTGHSNLNSTQRPAALSEQISDSTITLLSYSKVQKNLPVSIRTAQAPGHSPSAITARAATLRSVYDNDVECCEVQRCHRSI
ncbi:uncharacterized protein EI90DRAFT_555705 [Cantharellus anzutake]|uniref:uncharacterized protein n=1 Tax=Cantharellus anzutake TaxID=1750568 RepID=UPI0019088881|nr:uncharacterized protein EI90DRAFT_555705 [Cantharellus anzutake]KAF8313357.1 hypothetical protein EI90DRAFT_555705 [Cantharellus anzutake]